MAKAAKFEEDVNEALGIHPEQSPHSALQRAKWLKKQDKYQTEKLAEILGYKSDDFSALLEQVQRVIREHQTLLGDRIESNAKIDRLCASLDKVVPERDTLKAQVEGFVVELATARAEIAELRATRSACGYCSTHLERVEKERDNLKEQLNAIHVRMLDILGPNAGIAWPGIFDSVEKAVKAEADNKELEVKLSQANLTLERLRATLSATEKDRDALKERLETAITAERQTIAQRIDLALTGNAVATHLDTMLRAVGNSRRDTKIPQNYNQHKNL
jgi:septal ring factor EnvC (AmiA/AmiB activator)